MRRTRARLSQGSMPTNPTAIEPAVRSPRTVPRGRAWSCWSSSLPLLVERNGVLVRVWLPAMGCLYADRPSMSRRVGRHISRAASSSPGLQLELGKRAHYQMPGCRSHPRHCASVHLQQRVSGTVCVAPCSREEKALCALPATAF